MYAALAPIPHPPIIHMSKAKTHPTGTSALAITKKIKAAMISPPLSAKYAFHNSMSSGIKLNSGKSEKKKNEK